MPQGSVLGPLLFFIYINDIVNSSKLAHFVLFADDANIFVSEANKNEAYKNDNKVLSDIHRGGGPKWLDHMPVKGWVTQQAWPVRVWTLTGKIFINWST